MKDAVELDDPHTGLRVTIGRAELHQTCRTCGEQVVGKWIWAAGGEERAWSCLRHLKEYLMLHAATDRGVCEMVARQQLRDALPGDQVAVTRELLTALGL